MHVRVPSTVTIVLASTILCAQAGPLPILAAPTGPSGQVQVPFSAAASKPQQEPCLPGAACEVRSDDCKSTPRVPFPALKLKRWGPPPS
ncbi:hypothetical protein C8R43DRAFT_1240303 [Mycena crocata]|nr:hypothetical protein C8R43DRAFT_1240303 [Mycena crocata]